MSNLAHETAQPWYLETFSVVGQRQQGRVLDAFRRVRLPAVIVEGVDRDQEWFVIVDSPSIAHAVRSRRIVRGIDPHAVLTYSTNARS